MATKKKKSASLGCLFWIAFILLVLILFFFNKNTIQTNLMKTGAGELLFGGQKNKTEQTEQTKESGKPDIVVKPEEQPTVETKPEETAKPTPQPETKPDQNTKPAPQTETKPAPQSDTKPADSPAAKTIATTDNTNVKPKDTPVTQTPKTRKANLFFVQIDSDGRVVRKEVIREIKQTDSPLTETLTTLLAGVNSAEKTKGMRTLIPEGTKLLSVTVNNGVASINVSEEFQFNQFGIEGYLGQLAQIVYTATAYSTVSSVQFLIDGQKREYLGSEGIWIGSPLSRNSFKP